jgi:hypothetical protein
MTVIEIYKCENAFSHFLSLTACSGGSAKTLDTSMMKQLFYLCVTAISKNLLIVNLEPKTLTETE